MIKAFNYNVVIDRGLLEDGDIRGLNNMRGVTCVQAVGNLLVLRLDNKRDQQQVAREINAYLRPAIPEAFLEA